MNHAGALTIVLLFSILVEMFVEYFVSPAIPKPTNPNALKWYERLAWKRYAAAAGAIVLTLWHGLDVISILFPGYAASYVGMVLTGLLISRGANHQHDWIANPIVKLLTK